MRGYTFLELWPLLNWPSRIDLIIGTFRWQLVSLAALAVYIIARVLGVIVWS